MNDNKKGIATSTCSSAGADNGEDEIRLRERLKNKKEESRLRERIIKKKERRNSENSCNKNESPNNKGSPSNNDGKDSSSISHNKNNNSNNNNRNDDDSHKQSRSGQPLPRDGSANRRSNSRDRRSSSSQRRGGPPPRIYEPPHRRFGGDRMGRDLHRNHSYEIDAYGRRSPHPSSPHPAFRGGQGQGYHRGGPPMYNRDQYGRAPRRIYHQQQPSRRSGSRSISRSPSISSGSSRGSSPSRSPNRINGTRSSSRTKRKDCGGRDGGQRHKHKHARRSTSRSRRSRSPSTSGSSISSSSSSSVSSQDHSDIDDQKTKGDDPFSKDHRTVFVNQLVMRATEKDIRRYFRRKVGAKVNDVSLIRDRRTGKHKGFAYVEMKTMEDVNKALSVSGQPPDFQRFPILVKSSEAEKNYAQNLSATITATSKAKSEPLIGPNGQPIESQKVYVGSLDHSITQEHLFKLFSQFGDLTKVQLQVDPASGVSKGFAFLSFRDPKEAHLAIVTMANKPLQGRCIKTGWATMVATATPGVQVVTSDEFPEDASARASRALVALSQLSVGAVGSVIPVTTGTAADAAALANAAVNAAVAGGSLPATNSSKVPTVAEARQSLATGMVAGTTYPSVATTPSAVVAPSAASLASPDAKVIGRASNPSKHVLVHNMFCKDEETEEGWAEDIKLEFQEECSKFGAIKNVLVMSQEPGGKIYASFDKIECAQSCASSLAGRWFDKRQLRVEFVDEDQIPQAS